MTIEEALSLHAKKYPLSEPRDMVKLLYQAEFGGGHMIRDEKESLLRLRDEMRDAAGANAPLFEDIGGGACRMMLAPLREAGLSAETANALFVYGANRRVGDMRAFLQSLTILREKNDMPFDAAALEAYLTQYAAAGYPAVSHSARYRAAYRPAYRVVPAQARDYFPLFAAIDRLLSEKERVTVAIDGGSASGKSTLGRFVADVYHANLFHADDFFLPFARKTPERLAQPGGNIDYERMRDEVLTPLQTGRPFAYRPFRCATGTLAEDAVSVAPCRLNIVEGAYSMHPYFGDPYDLRVFLVIDARTQTRRIRARNGEAMLARFLGEWIPMEKTYFEAFSIREACEMTFDAPE